MRPRCKSINNLLLLGDGETWNRQKVDFAGLPEMVKTFLQVAAGAADIPVTRLLGQSPAGLSATGDSDTRNYYDMVSARQEADLRPTLERLDRLIARSEGLDPAALTFAFRPLWQLDAATAATVALQKVQAAQIYAGLNLWPAAVTARLVEAQLAEDGTYPNAAATFAEVAQTKASATSDTRRTADTFPIGAGAFNYLNELRELSGRWARGGGSGTTSYPDARFSLVADPNELKRQFQEGEAGGYGPSDDPGFPAGEDPIFKPVPGSASHGQLADVPSPVTAVLIVPGSSGAPPPASSSSPAASPSLPGIIGPGAFAREGVPTGSFKSPTMAQREEINRMGYEWGCHLCGSKDPGNDFGNFVPDHQPPNAFLREGDPQFLFPHCSDCSRRQGGLVRWLKEKGYQP